MSRLGDLLHTERLRRNMTLKQVAKLGGVSEGYLKDVEAGTRIIADDQARRILKKMGLTEQNEAGFSLDDIAATVDLQTAAPKAAPKPAPRAREAEKVYSSQSEEESKNITLLSGWRRVAGRAQQRAEAGAGVQRRHEGSGSPAAAHHGRPHRGFCA